MTAPMVAPMVRLLGIARAFDAAVVTSSYSVGALGSRCGVAIERAPNPWQRDRWTLCSAFGESHDEALRELVADLEVGDEDTGCVLCGRPGAVSLTVPHVIDGRHPACGRVLSRGVLCAVCSHAAASIDEVG